MPKLDLPLIYTPDNEPYLGRKHLKALDDMIVACLAANARSASWTHGKSLTPIQSSACQLIPQGVSLALSMRELIRQGYLFGALVLTRPLFERAAVLLYLEAFPESQAIWTRGWKHREAPTFARMIERIGGHDFSGLGHAVTDPLNALLHGRPDSAEWTLVQVGAGRWGHAPSKILDNPVLCDKIAVECAAILAILTTLMISLFPDAHAA